MAQKKKVVKKKLPVAKPPWSPKSHKELVEWFVVRIEGGSATKREFLVHAEKLKAEEKAAKKE